MLALLVALLLWLMVDLFALWVCLWRSPHAPEAGHAHSGFSPLLCVLPVYRNLRERIYDMAAPVRVQQCPPPLEVLLPGLA